MKQNKQFTLLTVAALAFATAGLATVTVAGPSRTVYAADQEQKGSVVLRYVVSFRGETHVLSERTVLNDVPVGTRYDVSQLVDSDQPNIFAPLELNGREPATLLYRIHSQTQNPVYLGVWTRNAEPEAGVPAVGAVQAGSQTVTYVYTPKTYTLNYSFETAAANGSLPGQVQSLLPTASSGYVVFDRLPAVYQPDYVPADQYDRSGDLQKQYFAPYYTARAAANRSQDQFLKVDNRYWYFDGFSTPSMPSFDFGGLIGEGPEGNADGQVAVIGTWKAYDATVAVEEQFVPFNTVYEEDENLPKGTTREKTPGSEGLNIVTSVQWKEDQVTPINNGTVLANKLNALEGYSEAGQKVRVLVKPVDRVVVRGTKDEATRVTFFELSYKFVSGTDGKELPAEIVADTPATIRAAKDSQPVFETPAKETYEVEGGTWTFKGYDKKHPNFVVTGDATVTGTWEFTPKETPAPIPPVKTTVMVYRFYNPKTGKHMYTRHLEAERAKLEARGYRYEGFAWETETTKGAPVYRLYNPKTDTYFYTMHMSEVEKLKAQNWRFEGVAFRSYGKTPIYRFYNQRTGLYIYSRMAEEIAKLKAHKDVRYEGFAWYGI